jgi:hypothetical protein
MPHEYSSVASILALSVPKSAPTVWVIPSEVRAGEH